MDIRICVHSVIMLFVTGEITLVKEKIKDPALSPSSNFLDCLVQFLTIIIRLDAGILVEQRFHYRLIAI